MTAATREREFPTAWLGSVLLHGALIAAALVSWNSRDMQGGTVVPVKIITNASQTDLRPAIEAPAEQTAQTESPVPDAPLETVAPIPDPAPPTPAPAPTPAPKTPPQKTAPAPTPAPKAPPQKATPTPAPKAPPQKATPTPAPKAPAPKAPAQKRPAEKTEDSLDLDALANSLAKMRPSGGSRSSAQKGQNRPETAREARPNAGEGMAASSIPGLQERLEDVWNPNCTVEGGRDVRVRVTFVVGPGGVIDRENPPTAGGLENSSNPVVRVAAERAIRAVRQAAPLTMVPRSNYGKPITANFDPTKGCAG
ncbi:energy transducer TonB [Phenylobacterium terrae]|uniref:Energy transducer TonB n=1 Tax=Phenylobacterium terrae TaxID=2665495 RepID=A0ABW4MYY8_9CAUL